MPKSNWGHNDPNAPRPIAPRGGPHPRVLAPQPELKGNVRPRRQITKRACKPCQAKKVKCDGNSPCTRCTLREIECVPSLNSDQISLQHAHANLEVQRRREEDYKRVFTVLQSGSDGDAAEILAHLRLGKDVSVIAKRLREESRDESPASTSSQDRDIRPPSRDPQKPKPSTWSIRALDQNFLVPLFDRRIWDVEEEEGDIDMIEYDTEIWQEPLMQLRYFGNLPFTSGVKANHYPANVQAMQVSNICNNIWAAMPANCRSGGYSTKGALSGILDIARQLIAAGTPAREITGEHHNVLAIVSPTEFSRSSLLSQWAARFIFSVTGTSRSLTSIAAAWRVWVLMRWRIDPSPETYAAMPDWMRPTVKQLLYPHVEIVDSIAYPKLRDAITSRPSMQAHPNLVWLMDAYRGCRCSFAMEFSDIVCYNKKTGQPDFTDHAKACVANLDNWTIGPVFRRYLPNMDQLVNIRLDDDIPEPMIPDEKEAL
ncbi:Proteasome A-type and B-type [Apiospora arundinis]|uniref:Conidial development protein fluffy n=1 Tax=Apiospora arundinis TaxID=335852 RepID=A0ABR2ITG8_9PEZI